MGWERTKDDARLPARQRSAKAPCRLQDAVSHDCLQNKLRSVPH